MNIFRKFMSMSLLLWAISSGAEGPSAPTGPLALSPDAPDTYTVVKGDTLWGIAGHFLRDPWRWPEIWHINEQIKDPHWIYPGDILHLIYVDGQPQVVVERGGSVHLTPQIRTQDLDQAIPAIPYEIVAAFMSKPSVIANEDSRDLPYVVAMRDRHVVIGGVGDTFYARGITGADPGVRYNVVRLARKLTDPDDHAPLGYMAVYSGSARVDGQGTIDRKPTDLTRLSIVESGREVEQGDKLVHDGVEIPLDFVPHAPGKQIDGKIIAVVDGVSAIGQYQVVAINRGHRHGLEPGHVLVTWQHADTVIDSAGRNPGIPREFKSVLPRHVQLPDERSGTLMVFRTYDRLSYALMLTSNTQVRVNDPVRNP